jgi:hypothetical protein
MTWPGRGLGHVRESLRLSVERQDGRQRFAASDGRPSHPNSLNRSHDAPVAMATVPAIRFHDFQVTISTLLLADCKTPKNVQERLV